jgi:hypothetical protein
MPTRIFRSDIKPGTPSRIVGNDVNGKLNEIVYHLNSDNSWATANDAENLRLVTQYAIKQYVASQISASGSTLDWQESVLASEGMIPISSYSHTVGDRYLCNNIDIGYEQYLNKIITWNGTGWDITNQSVGMMTYDEKYETFMFYTGEIYGWEEKSFGITYTGGNGITITGTSVAIKIETSNSGLTLSANGLKLKANTSNFKIDDTNGLGFKDGTAVGQVWYWNGSNWVADTIINLFASKYKTNVGFSGTKNGINKTFVVDNGAGVIIESTITVYKNAMRMTKDIDYTYVNATKTLTLTTDTNAPESDAVMVCDLCEV